MYGFKKNYMGFVDKSEEERMHVCDEMKAKVWEIIAQNSVRKDQLITKRDKGTLTEAENSELEQAFVVSEYNNLIFKELHVGNVLGAIKLDEELDTKINIKLFKVAA